MKKNVIGRFDAITFSDKYFEFIVYDDNTMDCISLNIYNINKIIIRPDFILKGYDIYFQYEAPIYHDGKPDYVKEYNISKELYEYLKENNMVTCDYEMSCLYNLRYDETINKEKKKIRFFY